MRTTSYRNSEQVELMISTKQNSHLLKCVDDKQEICFPRNEAYRRVVDICRQLEKQGVHSSAVMNAAGLTYTGVADTTRCHSCELQVSGWTEDMIPFMVHTERSPDCPFVQSIRSRHSAGLSPCQTSTTDDQENPAKRQKINPSPEHLLVEVEILIDVRRRTFSHWPHRSTPSPTQMISAGFFYCNVGDRVICLYCNLICQQWTPHTDDPYEVHQTLSTQCAYVRSMVKSRQTMPVSILNESSTSNATVQSRTADSLRSNEIVHASACHINYVEIPKRQASFASWAPEGLPSVDDLVRAGFFYTGSKTIVTCFYCNGSLQNWGPKDNPTIEHSRWFPFCAYAKQLCGDELYRKIQETKRSAQERVRANQSERSGTDYPTNSSRLQIPDESTLSRLVAARLDLPISQSLLNRDFKLSVIKRCWEDQLRLKQDDFTTDCDLLVACVILQKQIDHINGKKENIIVPSIKMKMIREKQETQTLAREQSATVEGSLLQKNPPNDTNNKASKSSTAPANSEQRTEVKTSPATDSSSSNLCVLCWTEERRLACIPCGHLTTCVPCGHSLRTCPICRKQIDAFIRIYI